MAGGADKENPESIEVCGCLKWSKRETVLTYNDLYTGIFGPLLNPSREEEQDKFLGNLASR